MSSNGRNKTKVLLFIAFVTGPRRLDK